MSSPASDADRPSLVARLFPETELTPIESAAVEDERQVFNIRRARLLLPFAFGLLVVSTLIFARFVHPITEAQRVWHQLTLVLNVVTLCSELATLVLLWRGQRAGSFGVDALMVWLLMWGGLASANVQRTRSTIDLFITSSMIVVLSFRPRLALLLATQVVAGLVLVAGILRLQADPTVWQTEIILVLVISAIAFTIGRANTTALIREVKTRRLIAQQQAELEALNVSLEDRVQSQVREIVTRSREIDQLNAELRQQVKERSQELSAALARIVRQHGEGGALAPGDTLLDRFAIEGVLGRGGMGTVYSAHDRVTQERVAIKVIEASSAHELDAINRFIREAHASARINHPAVVYARHVDIADGVLFMVFAFIEGESLQGVLLAQRAISPRQVARLGALVADALAAAHVVGVVHRDIKPGNIMVSGDLQTVRLLDFGISKLRDASMSDSSETREGALLGTPMYMAPEQASGSANATDRSDVYALGVVLYELLAGRPPFGGSNLRAVLIAHVLSEPPPLASLRPDLPEALVALIHRCLAKTPEARPSAAELAASLSALEPSLDAIAAPSLPPPTPAVSADSSTLADTQNPPDLGTTDADGPALPGLPRVGPRAAQRARWPSQASRIAHVVCGASRPTSRSMWPAGTQR